MQKFNLTQIGCHKNVKYAYQESPHSENTASPRSEKEGKRACVYKNINFKRTPQTINEKENPWGYRLGTVSGKTICHWGLKPGCTNLTLAPTGSRMNKQAQLVLVK
jgi:hypothetical protein